MDEQLVDHLSSAVSSDSVPFKPSTKFKGMSFNFSDYCFRFVSGMRSNIFETSSGLKESEMVFDEE
jgi:hypothetical protein